ncbi:putative MFS-type transporter [Neolecta irregularis DAH-3]|uniref:Putative MFS-type transporter n=1 Tax=Neolecta irregularis (strain DAH-3) TaxID=1198029 RepID=A0A1U7LML4_NEOID|nr:putative MFS-type transporter [Neolecta irregularis DAH-3]|eukprot:OLL23895.1 putative MFS-type transporter [Neolecta irregularis DAH-3]
MTKMTPIESQNVLPDDSGTKETIRELSNAVDVKYSRKVKILNAELEKIGYGRYQKRLFLFAGLAYCNNDSLIFATAACLPSIIAEWNPEHAPMATLALNSGVLTGSIFWGIISDVYGRRQTFNLTSCISSLCAILCGCSPSFPVFCIANSLIGFGIGGILTMNAALFLESIQPSKQGMMMFLSIGFAAGTALGTFSAWPLIKYFSCIDLPDHSLCTRKNNMGWRYLYFILGTLDILSHNSTTGGLAICSFVIRIPCHHLLETPKWLLSKDREADMLIVLQAMAKRNHTTSSLTLSDLQEKNSTLVEVASRNVSIPLPRLQHKFKLIHSLFSSKQLGIFTLMITLIWGAIGLAYPLFNYFLPIYLGYVQIKISLIANSSHQRSSNNSSDAVSGEFAIITFVGIPASFLSVYLVSTSVGRRGVMSISAFCVGLFLILFTRAYDKASIMGLNCCICIFQTIVYGVLYSYTSEVFPAPIRGTGNGLVISFNRFCGLVAPLIASYTDLENNFPIFVSAGLFFASSILLALLPFETRGTISL